ncbi:MAG: hypothetical protein K2X09_02420 [Rickettsiales bacterium]|nr:hypothetical protein [Rickettsiales bacterium]
MSDEKKSTIPPLLRDIAAVNIAKHCLLPNPRPEPPQNLWGYVNSLLQGHTPKYDDAPILCINTELKRSLPAKHYDTLQAEDKHAIFVNACEREALGRAKGQIREYRDPSDEPHRPLNTPRVVGPKICKALLN